MQTGLIMDLDQKSKSRCMPTSESVLFFSGPPFKCEFFHPKKEGAGTEEIKEKANTNFPKLFQEMVDGYLEQSLTPSQVPFDIPYPVQHTLLVTT
jgi:hypothetical protein